MKREAEATQRKQGKFVAPAEGIFTHRPRLAEALCDQFWDDGTPRDPWGVSLNWSGLTVTASLNDRPRKRSLNSSGANVDEALNALEGALGMPQIPWRSWGKGK